MSSDLGGSQEEATALLTLNLFNRVDVIVGEAREKETSLSHRLRERREGAERVCHLALAGSLAWASLISD